MKLYGRLFNYNVKGLYKKLTELEIFCRQACRNNMTHKHPAHKKGPVQGRGLHDTSWRYVCRAGAVPTAILMSRDISSRRSKKPVEDPWNQNDHSLYSGPSNTPLGPAKAVIRGIRQRRNSIIIGRWNKTLWKDIYSFKLIIGKLHYCISRKIHFYE